MNVAKAVIIKGKDVTGRGPTGGQEFERLFSRLSSAFAKVPDAKVDSTIEFWLRRLVKFLGVDRAGVSQVLADGQSVHLTHFYRVRGSPPRPGTVLHDHYPWFAEQVRSGKIIRFERSRDSLPAEAMGESGHVTRARLKSHLMLPLTSSGARVGALAFGSFRRYRRWPDELVQRLELVAQVFANALARKQARQRLEERLGFERLITKLVRTFVDVAPDEVDEQIRKGLGRLVESLGLDEAYLGRVSEKGALVITRVAREGASRESTVVGFPEYVEALRDRHTVVANSRQDVAFLELNNAGAEAGLSRHAPDDASRVSSFTHSHLVVDHGPWFELHELKSQVSIPLVAENRLWGTITAAAFHRPLEWTVWEIQQLRLVGEIMMAAVVRREIEEKARRQRDELAYATQVAALGELTAALAHELNQPLTAIRANAQATRRLLASGRESDELEQVFADIVGDATRAAELIVRLRNLLRRHELEKGWLDLNQVIEDVRPTVDAEARRHGAGLVLALASGLPNIRGDAMQLQQVLLNLVRNAAEAMADRVATPRVVVRTCAAPPEHVTVSIEDTGPRIDDSTFDKMFLAFHTTKPEGLGMGLAISRSIIEAHGGRLWAERQPETGMALRISLPAARGCA